MPSARRSILVLTCGNALAGDDALGSAVARRLAGDSRCLVWPSDDQAQPPVDEAADATIEVVDAAMSPGSLLDCAVGHEAVIVVDGVSAPGLAPGQVVEMDWFAPGRPALADERVLSTHGWSIGQELDLARELDMLPSQVLLIGAGIASAEVGVAMGSAVQACVTEICRRIAAYAVFAEPTQEGGVSC